MTHRLKRPIPKGYQIYTDFEVAGLLADKHRQNFEEFIRGTDWEISLIPEPGNPYDANAIAVYGEYTSSKGNSEGTEPQRTIVQLGYVPRSIAQALQATFILPHIIPRLNAFSEPGEQWISMIIHALGPKNSDHLDRYYAHFESKINSKPATFESRTFIRLCGRPVKRGLTTAEGNRIVNQIREDLTRENPAKLAEIDGLLRTIDSLIDDLSDTDNADIYDMKKAPPSLVVSTVLELLSDGVSATQVADDFELVANAILKRKPSLSKL